MTQGPVLILGARSDIARALAHDFAQSGVPLYLAGRNLKEIEKDAADLCLRYDTPATAYFFDALDIENHAAFIDALPDLPEDVICVVGQLGDQEENQHNLGAAVQVMRNNFEGPASILGLFANRFEARGYGTIVGFSSVAGDRGRASNYIYGASKAGMTAFLSGLRNRLSKTGVHVVTVLPGFVDTAMTAGMDLPKRLTASPDTVARAVRRAMIKKQNILYVKPIWRWIMWIIRHLPETLFKRTRL